MALEETSIIVPEELLGRLRAAFDRFSADCKGAGLSDFQIAAWMLGTAAAWFCQHGYSGEVLHAIISEAVRKSAHLRPLVPQPRREFRG